MDSTQPAPVSAPAAAAPLTQPNLTVVIPHYRGEHLLPCLRALAGQSTRNFVTVVVLDATPAEPTIPDADRPPNLQFVRSAPATAPKGLGFTAAANVGLAQVKTPYVLLINDDVFLDSAFIAEGLKILEHRPTAAAVAGALLQEHRPDRIDNLGIAYEPPGHGIRIGHNRPAHDLLGEGFQRWLYGPSGAAGMYRTETLRQVAWPGGGVRSNTLGIFDERLEAYYDDVDLILRLIYARAATWFCPRMVARHVGHATYGAKSKALVRLSARNSKLVYNTFIEPAQRLIGLPYRLPFSAAQGIYRLCQGRGVDFLKGKFDPAYQGILAARRAEWTVLQARFRDALAAQSSASAGATESASPPGAARSQA